MNSYENPRTMKNQMITTFKKLILAIMLAATLSGASSAQELSPDLLALARKYVDLTDQSQVYEVILIETGIATMRTLVAQNPKLSQEVSDAIGTVIKQYNDSKQKDELFDQFARVYASRFTKDELQKIVAFYESDVGIKLSKENAAANTELKTVMQVYRNNLNTEFFAKVRAVLRDQGVKL
ncbi:hypothetical protein MNBD_ALPHA12-433 [hydrothermal vent metagenome]|uniref:DUF2059 domain-containing protein n=1 Tax=hydrothermal vent metagenome TaxID=652676 RepID=A0A3B0TT27_9ZZZZ